MLHFGPVAASLLGLGASAAKTIADAFLGELTKWVAAGAGDVLEALGAVLTSTTTPDLTVGFPKEYSVMLAIGAAVTLPLLLLAVIQAIVRQDLGGLLRAALLRLPVAMLVSAAAVELVSLALQASDAMSGALLAAAGHPVDGFITSLVQGLTKAAVVTTGPSGAMVLGGFAALLLAVMAALVSFVLWFELVLRSAAIAASTLFLPLALAGLVWPATAHWARRLAETLAALILAKVAIAGVLALAAVELTTSEVGAGGIVEGIALILLATLAPYSLLRLIPMVEGGAVTQFDGMTHRAAGRMARFAAGHVPGGSGDKSSGSSGSGGSSGAGGAGGAGAAGPGGGRGGGPGGGGPPVVDDVPAMAGVRVTSPEILAEADRIERVLGESGGEP